MFIRICESFRVKMLLAIFLVAGLLTVSEPFLYCQSQPAPSGFPQGILQLPTQPSLPGVPNAAQPASPAGQNTQETIPPSENVLSPNIIVQTAALVFVSLLPYLVILLTAYIKVVVVLSLLRNALGLQQSPPSQVINGLALVLSVYVMYPTGTAMYNAGTDLINKAPSELVSKESSAFLIEFVNVTKEPLKQFLIRNTSAKHLKSFYQLAYKAMPDNEKQNLKETDYLVVIPSYITSQLKDSYEIGVLIYLPFFVIDLVVSNILLAMGMMMLSPLTIALPLKLLLLVMLDGWTVLIQGLVQTFK